MKKKPKKIIIDIKIPSIILEGFYFAKRKNDKRKK